MSPYQFLTQLDQTPPAGGDGVRVSRNYGPAELRTTAGLTLTGATAPTIANVETNAIAVAVAPGTTAGGSFVFPVPLDYDETADELKIIILAESGGTTDFPTIDAQVFQKRAGAALSSDLNPSPSAAVPQDAGEVTIDVSGKGIKGGDVLTINLVTGTHATDAVIIHAVRVQYRSGIVFNDPAKR